MTSVFLVQVWTCDYKSGELVQFCMPKVKLSVSKDIVSDLNSLQHSKSLEGDLNFKPQSSMSAINLMG